MGFVYGGPEEGAVNSAISALTDAFRKNIGENLKGFYLHGSLAMGCFRPWSSDIDLLAVVFAPMDRKTKLALVRDIMGIAEGGREFIKIEFSVVTAEEAARARHPIGYILHYSDGWHQAYKENRADLVIEGGGDEDLAAHFKVVRERGVVLDGAPIMETFGEVSREDYLKSVWYDVAGAENEAEGKPVYTVLNLCRTLLYLRAGRVGSKLEGGRWALVQPELAAWKPIVAMATDEYASGRKGTYDTFELMGFVRFALFEIKRECCMSLLG